MGRRHEDMGHRRKGMGHRREGTGCRHEGSGRRCTGTVGELSSAESGGSDEAPMGDGGEGGSVGKQSKSWEGNADKRLGVDDGGWASTDVAGTGLGGRGGGKGGNARGGGTLRGAISTQSRGQDRDVSEGLSAGGNDMSCASGGGEGGLLAGNTSHGRNNKRVGN
jgi:hypothetical protein